MFISEAVIIVLKNNFKHHVDRSKSNKNFVNFVCFCITLITKYKFIVLGRS